MTVDIYTRDNMYTTVRGRKIWVLRKWNTADNIPAAADLIAAHHPGGIQPEADTFFIIEQPRKP